MTQYFSNLILVLNYFFLGKKGVDLRNIHVGLVDVLQGLPAVQKMYEQIVEAKETGATIDTNDVKVSPTELSKWYGLLWERRRAVVKQIDDDFETTMATQNLSKLSSAKLAKTALRTTRRAVLKNGGND